MEKNSFYVPTGKESLEELTRMEMRPLEILRRIILNIMGIVCCAKFVIDTWGRNNFNSNDIVWLVLGSLCLIMTELYTIKMAIKYNVKQ